MTDKEKRIEEQGEMMMAALSLALHTIGDTVEGNALLGVAARLIVDVHMNNTVPLDKIMAALGREVERLEAIEKH